MLREMRWIGGRPEFVGEGREGDCRGFVVLRGVGDLAALRRQPAGFVRVREERDRRARACDDHRLNAGQIFLDVFSEVAERLYGNPTAAAFPSRG